MKFFREMTFGQKLLSAIGVLIGLNFALVAAFIYVVSYTEFGQYFVRSDESVVDDDDSDEVAIEKLSKAIKWNPNYSRWYIRRGWRYLQIKQWDKGLKDYSKVVELGPENPYGYYYRGDLYERLGMYSQSVNDLKTGANLNVDKKEIKNRKNYKYTCQKSLAATLEHMMLNEEAIKEYKKYLKWMEEKTKDTDDDENNEDDGDEVDGDDAENSKAEIKRLRAKYYLKLAKLYRRTGKLNEARNYLQKVIDLDVEEYTSRAYYKIAILEYYQKNYPKAVEYFTEKIKKFGAQGMSGPFVNRAEMYEDMGKPHLAKLDLRIALQIIDKKLSENDSSEWSKANLLKRKGIIHNWLGEEKLAKVAWAEAIDEFINNEKSHSSGSTIQDCCTLLNDPERTKLVVDKRIKSFTKAIKKNNFSISSYASRAEFNKFRGDIEAAKADWKKITEISKRSTITSRHDLDDIYGAFFELGDKKGFNELLDRQIKLNKSQIKLEPKAACVYDKLGISYELKEDYDKAIAEYTKAIKLQSGDSWLYRHRARAFIKQGKPDEALKDLDKALSFNEDYSEVYERMAQAWLMKKEPQKALKAVEKALKIKFASNTAFHWRAKAYEMLGKYKLAKADFERAKFYENYWYK